MTSCNNDKSILVEIKTNMGDVTVKLYDDTPLHRDNFINLCESGVYNGVLFHRIIADFVVQGGDPESKEKVPGAPYGSGNGGFTVPAEILPHYYNKRGALIDAKQGDSTNYKRASAGTHFCFIQGKIHSDESLDLTEVRINKTREDWYYFQFKARLKEEKPEITADTVLWMSTARQMAVDTVTALGTYHIPQEQREVYKTTGGSPHLDGSVTIFGEVVKGLDIVEKMSKVETDRRDRPIEDVIIESTKVIRR
jgi:peptidyl-prolyl cis-trans isomerase B (cyclophilin B)